MNKHANSAHLPPTATATVPAPTRCAKRGARPAAAAAASRDDVVHAVHAVVLRRSGHVHPLLRRHARRARVERRVPARCGERHHDLVVRRRPAFVGGTYEPRAVRAATKPAKIMQLARCVAGGKGVGHILWRTVQLEHAAEHCALCAALMVRPELAQHVDGR